MSRSTGLFLHRTHEFFSSSIVNRALTRIGDRFRHFGAINELEQLSDRQLRDIGLERRQIIELAEREIAGLKAR